MMKHILFILAISATFQLQAQDFEWVATNSGTESELVAKMATDADGNVYTTGAFQGTVDFDPEDGATFNLTSTGWADIFVQKLNSDGELLWAKAITSTETKIVSDITVDASGNCFVTGKFLGTADFDPSGGTLNLTSGGIYDAFIQKLDPNGNLVWARSFGGDQQDDAFGITTDADGNCYTIGSFIESADIDPSDVTASWVASTNTSVFIQKLDSDGLFVWGRQLIPTGSAQAFPGKIAVDGSNNVIIVGSFNETVDFNPSPGFDHDVTALGAANGYMVKLSDEGWFEWMIPYLSTSSVSLSFVSTDDDGNIYTAGNFNGTVDVDPSAGTHNLITNGDYDYFVQKVDPSGNHIWANSYGGTDMDQTACLRLDHDENIYTGGLYTGPVDFDPSGDDFELISTGYFIQKSNNDGSFQFAMDAEAYLVAPSNDGSFYLGGSFEGTVDFDPSAGDASVTALGMADACIIKFGAACTVDNSVSQSGITLTSNQAGASYQWVDCNDSNAPIPGETNQIFTPTINGNYAVEVTFDGCTELSSCFLIGDVGVSENDDLTSIYPNPTNGTVNVASHSEISSVELFSLSGEKLEAFTTKQFDISYLPSGIYLLKINGENTTSFAKITKK